MRSTSEPEYIFIYRKIQLHDSSKIESGFSDKKLVIRISLSQLLNNENLYNLNKILLTKNKQELRHVYVAYFTPKLMYWMDWAVNCT